MKDELLEKLEAETLQGHIGLGHFSIYTDDWYAVETMKYE